MFTITCNKCGNQVEYKEGLYIPKANVVLYKTGLICDCGNSVEVIEDHVTESKLVPIE